MIKRKVPVAKFLGIVGSKDGYCVRFKYPKCLNRENPHHKLVIDLRPNALRLRIRSFMDMGFPVYEELKALQAFIDVGYDLKWTEKILKN